MLFSPDDLDEAAQLATQQVADGVMAQIVKRGLSVARVAELSGISGATLHRHLHAQWPFNTDELGRLGLVLEVDMPTLVNPSALPPA